MTEKNITFFQRWISRSRPGSVPILIFGGYRSEIFFVEMGLDLDYAYLHYSIAWILLGVATPTRYSKTTRYCSCLKAVPNGYTYVRGSATLNLSTPLDRTFLPAEAEFLVEKPGTKTGLLPGFFVFSSRHLLSSNARYFCSFASFSSRFLQFV